MVHHVGVFAESGSTYSYGIGDTILITVESEATGTKVEMRGGNTVYRCDVVGGHRR